jgi:hypothetical protein
MEITSRIIAARGGNLIVEIRPGKVTTVEAAAAQFGLFSSPRIYVEISEQEAVSVLCAVIGKDMAYQSELMPPQEANTLAKEFVHQFAGDRAKFYTNGEYGKPRQSQTVGPSWMPATEATFDTGVLVVAPERIGCAWFMDED